MKDRLSAWFHWNDRQSLEQAVMVARAQVVDMVDLRKWAQNEGKSEAFRDFRRLIDD